MFFSMTKKIRQSLPSYEHKDYVHLQPIFLSLCIFLFIYCGLLKKNLTKAICNFIWTNSINSKKAVIMAWETCYLPRSSGGLGIKNLKVFNETLHHNLTL